MNFKKYLFSLTIFLILISISLSCNKRTKSDTSISNGPVILKGQKTELSETLSAIDLKIVDSLLIILTYGDSYKFHIYNKNTLKPIGNFGREGRGPSEYVIPLIMSQKKKIRDSSYLIIHDNTLKRTNYVNILKAINNTNYYPKSIKSRDTKISQVDIIGSAVIAADSFIVGTSNNSKAGRFFCYDIYKNILTWEPYYPVTKILPDKIVQNELYSSYLALRPNASDIAAASLFFKRIDILDKKGRLKRSIIFDQKEEPDFSNADRWPPKGSHEYFTSVSVTQDFIYALDIDLNVDDHKIKDTVSLIKTSWEDLGTPPEIFKITPKILKMAVDEENNKLFGIELFTSSIYVYEMNKNQGKNRK